MTTNLTTLLSIADNNAFSNLFEVTVGADSNVRTTFKIRIESINVDGYDIEYTLNEATKQNQLTKASKARNISMRVRESSDFFFYKYMYQWYTEFYDPVLNRYRIGSTDNSDKADIVKKRTVELKAMGNVDSSTSILNLVCNNAMPKKVPSLSFNYTSSTPLIYDLSFVSDNIKMNHIEEPIVEGFEVNAYQRIR